MSQRVDAGPTKVCPRCGVAKDRDADFHKDPRTGQVSTYCRPCKKEYQRERYLSQGGIDRTRADSWMRRYGLTPEDYWRMHGEQGGLCAACRQPQPEEHKYQLLHVDHCHATGRVRGLLCFPCNLLEGVVEKYGENRIAAVMAYRAATRHAESPIPDRS